MADPPAAPSGDGDDDAAAGGRAAAGRRRPGSGARPGWTAVVAWVTFAWSLALAAYYLVSPVGLVVVPPLAGLTALVSLVAGTFLHRPEQRRLWVMMAVAVVFWLLGASLRGQQVGGAPLASDLLTLPGYLLVLVAYLTLLRSRGVMRHRGAVLDGLVLGTSTVLLTWRFMVEPLILGAPVPPRQLVFDLVYPVIDIMLMLILTQLSFTDASRTPSYWLFAISMGGLLTGDLLWNAAAAGSTVGTRAVTLPYVIAYGSLGASAWHPSMTRLTTAQRLRDALPVPRVVLLAIALAVPTTLTMLWPGTSRADRVLAGACLLGMSLLVLMRTARATNAFARQADRFAHSATHDELTGLPNRRLLRERLRGSIEEGGAVPVVFFLDLDDFKLVNDSWGHEVGDELLVEVSARLQQAVGPGELVARVSGDEFVVLARMGTGEDGVSRRDVERLGTSLLASFTEPFTISPGEMFATASIGVSWLAPGQARGDGGQACQEAAVELLRDADTAMYTAKAQGRGRLVPFDVTLRDQVRDRLDLENALRRAIGTEQLSLAYQPLIDLASGQLIGWEALARWDRPDLGPVSPAEFIPLAEQTGLIIPFGEWVVQEALSQLATWRSLLECHGLAGCFPRLHVAVNVASRQLHDAHLVDLVEATLRRHDLPGGSLCVEITESAIVDDDPECSERIASLRRLGCSIAVDDFGTGYSALGYLKRFPVTDVKIDRSFVSGLESSPDDTAIVRAVVAMSQALGLHLVAEGIETEGQAAILADLGCDTGQGYLLGRPAAPGAAGEDMLRRAREHAGRPHPSGSATSGSATSGSATSGPVRSMP